MHALKKCFTIDKFNGGILDLLVGSVWVMPRANLLLIHKNLYDNYKIKHLLAANILC